MNNSVSDLYSNFTGVLRKKKPVKFMYYLENLFIFSFNVFCTLPIRLKHLLVCCPRLFPTVPSNFFLSDLGRKKFLFFFLKKTERLCYTGTNGRFCRPAKILTSVVAVCLSVSGHFLWAVAGWPAPSACSCRLDWIFACLKVADLCWTGWWHVRQDLFRSGQCYLRVDSRYAKLWIDVAWEYICVYDIGSLYYLPGSQSLGVLGTMKVGGSWAASGLWR